MAKEAYKKQVKLLLSVLPEIARETCFALHGGTAINLFIREMPRMSVDIDLTYVPCEERETSLEKISIALERCKARIQKVFPNATIAHKNDTSKLLITEKAVDIKVEVNTVIRGTISDPTKMELCTKAQKDMLFIWNASLIILKSLFLKS